MKLILYDFDKTIYDGDSSFDFFLFCILKKPILITYIPKMAFAIIMYKLKIIDKTKMKTKLFSFLKRINNVDNYVQLFWDKNENKIKKFYIEKEHNKDIIISASPEFLLKPIAKKYMIKDLIGTTMDKKTGIIEGKNCWGEEKVKRFSKKYDKKNIHEMYSDSYSDLPLLKLAEKSYIIKKNVITEYKKS